MTVYISGPITKDPDYRQKFMKRAQELQKTGYNVVNPVVISDRLEMQRGKENLTYADYMKEDIRELLYCDAISCLPGWNESKGARLEHEIAEIIGLACVDMLAVRRADEKHIS